jgi:hypothetical protein
MTAWVDGLAEIGFGGLLHLLQDEGGDFGRRVFLVAAFDPGVAVRALDDLVRDETSASFFVDRVVEGAADQALDRGEGVRDW